MFTKQNLSQYYIDENVLTKVTTSTPSIINPKKGNASLNGHSIFGNQIQQGNMIPLSSLATAISATISLPPLKIVDDAQEIADGDSEIFNFSQTLSALHSQGYKFLWIKVRQLNSSEVSCITIPLSQLIVNGSAQGESISIMGPSAHTIVVMTNTQITFNSVSESFDEQIVIAI